MLLPREESLSASRFRKKRESGLAGAQLRREAKASVHMRNPLSHAEDNRRSTA